MTRRIYFAALLAAAGWAGWLAGDASPRLFLSTLLTAAIVYLALLGLAGAWRRWRDRPALGLLATAALLVGLALYLLLSLTLLRPDLLPQQTYYDFIANRRVTEQLVDPALFKVERWEILGQEREVLFVHPAPSGSTTLAYPLYVEPRTTLRTDLAVAPEAWSAEGDGVTFSIYVEDDAGMHLLYSRYVDPKHHQQDRRWLPVRVDLSPFAGQLVRVILAVNSGPAGDARYDWAGWGEPRLERPIWP